MAAVELPAEIIDQILKDVEGVEDADSRYVCPLPTVSPPGSRRRSMAQIRLVNRAFHDIATPRLFRNFDARFSPSSSDGPRRWASKLLDLSESPLADHIKTLEIGFARAWVYHNNPSPFLMEAAFAIPTLMRACNQLRVLSISGSVRTSVLRVDQDEQYYDIFMKTIEVTLRSFSRNSFHATLDTLEMRLPLAYDYARLATSLAPVSSIQHLEIAISDASGSGGGRFDYGGDSHRHRSHPNRAHTAGFWNFITTIAANLQSLCIACTHVLDLDLLPIDDLDSLRELVLRRVQMSQRKFVHFTTQNASSLRAIELDRVELDSGSWEKTLLHLCALPQLDHFFIDSCGYTRTGASQDLFLGLFPEVDNPQTIESVNLGDRYALGNLQRRVNEIRGAAGLGLYNGLQYREATRETLAEWRAGRDDV